MMERDQGAALLGDYSPRSAKSGRRSMSLEEKRALPPVRGQDQLQALLRRQWLHKVPHLPCHCRH